MIKVAITGNIAAGKSTVEDFLIKTGYKSLDTDKVCHELLNQKEIVKKITKQFGKEVLSKGKVCRKTLGRIIFDEKSAKANLEAILHPLVKIEIEKFLKQNENEKLVFVSIPLLYEASFAYLFDKVILVYANDDLRLNRIIARDKLSKEEAQKRLQNQISQEEKLHLADFVFYNNDKFDGLVLSKIVDKCL